MSADLAPRVSKRRMAAYRPGWVLSFWRGMSPSRMARQLVGAGCATVELLVLAELHPRRTPANGKVISHPCLGACRFLPQPRLSRGAVFPVRGVPGKRRSISAVERPGCPVPEAAPARSPGSPADGTTRVGRMIASDLSGHSPEQRDFVGPAHVRSPFFQHQTGVYPGPVTLLRSRGHQFLCSFDLLYGWEVISPKGGVSCPDCPRGAREHPGRSPMFGGRGRPSFVVAFEKNRR